jgi:hypothetical protein
LSGKAEFFSLAMREFFFEGGLDSSVLPSFKKSEQRSQREKISLSLKLEFRLQ